jgi:hypothetical protein
LGNAIEQIQTASAQLSATGDVDTLKASLEAAMALILQEHQDWNLLVRPHHLPLA